MSDELAARLRAAGFVFAQEEAQLLRGAAAGDAVRLEALVSRRLADEPLEHVVGRVELLGHHYAVAPGVFVPRARTEALVELVLERTAHVVRPAVLDACCGCGALGLAYARERDVASLDLVDVDERAVACARANAATGDARVRVHRLDVTQQLPATPARFDVVLANVPYVPTGDVAQLPASFRRHEAPACHDGGHDGLQVLDGLLRRVAPRLAPAALLACELAEHQLERAAQLAAGIGLKPASSYDEARETHVFWCAARR